MSVEISLTDCSGQAIGTGKVAKTSLQVAPAVFNFKPRLHRWVCGAA
jgi:hypothetical protein